MQNAAPKAIAIQKAIEDVMHHDRGRLLAGLIAALGEFQLAEDALQDALISAMQHWSRSGIPSAPKAWLMKVARNKGIDRLRARLRESSKVNAYDLISAKEAEPIESEEIPDERLRLIFTCCHPALDEKSRVALTLRTVCNLTTREIADAFLDREATMGQRLSRAKAKIKAKGIAYKVPPPEDWPGRLSTVLSSLYLIFTTGYVHEGDQRDLCEEAIFLVRLLKNLRQGDPEIEGALSLMLFTQARRDTRISPDGAILPIEDQCRQAWSQPLLDEAQHLITTAIQRRNPGPYQIKAAIADCHMSAPSPDWRQMSFLYEKLWAYEPTPVVALNWAVIIAELGLPDLALKQIGPFRDSLVDYQPWHAAQASFLSKLGRYSEARLAYEHAIRLAQNPASRRFLEHKLASITDLI